MNILCKDTILNIVFFAKKVKMKFAKKKKKIDKEFRFLLFI